MKTKRWLIRADGIGLFEVVTSDGCKKDAAIAKAVFRVPMTATFHKLTAHAILDKREEK